MCLEWMSEEEEFQDEGVKKFRVLRPSWRSEGLNRLFEELENKRSDISKKNRLARVVQIVAIDPPTNVSEMFLSGDYVEHQ